MQCILEAIIDLIIQKLHHGFSGQRRELLPYFLRHDTVVHAGANQFDEGFRGEGEFIGQLLLDLADVLQLFGRVDDGFQVKGCLGQLGELGNHMLIKIQQIQF